MVLFLVDIVVNSMFSKYMQNQEKKGSQMWFVCFYFQVFKEL